MPELPEVETVIQSLRPHLTDRIIEHAEFYSRLVTRGDHARISEALARANIRCIRRRGKQIFLDLDRGVIYIHLGMTGKLLWNAWPGKYTRAIFELGDGRLIYDDVRQLGRVEYFETLPRTFDRAGPDALEIAFRDFFKRMKQHRTQIKALLLNQHFISGVGNIYADESLFAARVHPRTPVHRIAELRAERLFDNLIEVLKRAVEHRGSSISDYVDGAGKRGDFQLLHSVYGRAGKPCLVCGTPVRRIVVAQRGTHYCPRCQRV